MPSHYFVHLIIHSIRPSILPIMSLSISPSVCQSISPSVHQSISPSVHQSVTPSVHLIKLSMHLCIRLSHISVSLVYLSLFSVHLLFICLSIALALHILPCSSLVPLRSTHARSDCLIHSLHSWDRDRITGCKINHRDQPTRMAFLLLPGRS